MSESERETVWMCGACGKTGPTRETIGDESCWMHGVLVYVDSIIRNINGKAVGATAVKGQQR